MSCCGACGGQNTDKDQKDKQNQEQEQKPAQEQPSASVQNWDGEK